MKKNEQKIRIVNSNFWGKYCLKTNKGKRLTPHFSCYAKRNVGDFTELETEIATYVYHKHSKKLLYETTYEDELVELGKLMEDLYYIRISHLDLEMAILQFYSDLGAPIHTMELEYVFPINKVIFAAKEVDGNWGILDKELNWRISPVYENMIELPGGNIAGYLNDTKTTDLINVDDYGNINITNIEGYYYQHLNKDLLVVRKNKKQGVCNIKGEKILDFAYDEIRLVDEYFILQSNSLFGLAKITGEILYNCEYYQISRNEKGFELLTRKIIETTEQIIA